MIRAVSVQWILSLSCIMCDVVFLGISLLRAIMEYCSANRHSGTMCAGRGRKFHDAWMKGKDSLSLSECRELQRRACVCMQQSSTMAALEKRIHDLEQCAIVSDRIIAMVAANKPISSSNSAPIVIDLTGNEPSYAPYSMATLQHWLDSCVRLRVHPPALNLASGAYECSKFWLSQLEHTFRLRPPKLTLDSLIKEMLQIEFNPDISYEIVKQPKVPFQQLTSMCLCKQAFDQHEFMICCGKPKIQYFAHLFIHTFINNISCNISLFLCCRQLWYMVSWYMH